MHLSLQKILNVKKKSPKLVCKMFHKAPVEENFAPTGLKSSSLFEKISCSLDPTTNSETKNPNFQ